MSLFEIIKLSVLLAFSCKSFSLTSQNAMMVIDSAKGGGQDGLFIEYASDDGVHVNSAIDNGFEINSAGNIGLFVNKTGDDGLFVVSAGGDGVFVNSAGGHGIHVDNAGIDGIVVEGAERWSMNIVGNKNSGGVLGHVAHIVNNAMEGSADVLALQVGESTNPNSNSNFITFYHGNNSSLGAIEGNGNGGIVLTSLGSDFAEYLPKAFADKFLAGDIIGVSGGEISHNTTTASQIMVITDRPAVLGNQPDNPDRFEKVSFIGQVPVRVKGKVNAGDWIVASGLNNGTGVAISPTEVTLDHKIVGQAWESSTDPGIKKVNTAVGLDKSQAKDFILERMKQEMETQKIEFQSQIDELKRMIMESKS